MSAYGKSEVKVDAVKGFVIGFGASLISWSAFVLTGGILEPGYGSVVFATSFVFGMLSAVFALMIGSEMSMME